MCSIVRELAARTVADETSKLGARGTSFSVSFTNDETFDLLRDQKTITGFGTSAFCVVFNPVRNRGGHLAEVQMAVEECHGEGGSHHHVFIPDLDMFAPGAAVKIASRHTDRFELGIYLDNGRELRRQTLLCECQLPGLGDRICSKRSSYRQQVEIDRAGRCSPAKSIDLDSSASIPHRRAGTWHSKYSFFNLTKQALLRGRRLRICSDLP